MKLYFEQLISDSEYQKNATNFLSSLNGSEYSDILHYTDSGHSSINRALQNPVMDDSMFKIVDNIDSGLSKTQPKKKTLYRGASFKEFSPSGDMFTSESYLSATYSPVQALKFIKNKTAPVIYVIECFNGAEVSSIHDEYEVIIPRGSKFSIQNIKTNIEYTALYYGTDYDVSLQNVTIVYMSEVVDN